MEQGFEVFRKVLGGTETPIATLPANTTTFTDDSVDPSTTYVYRIRAYNGSGEVYSGELTVTTDPLPVPGTPTLTILAQTYNSVSLSWTNVDLEDSYEVLRLKDGVETSIATLSANVTTYSDSTVSDSTTY
ncbi:MAG: hypothetical protein DHS20C13_29870 [Thermodesulfobacteriota bacterium]|nr:MAG: hypothetical protein DHS20C13_29870 [Thermodesulfobacteriota bacterium]